MTSAIRLMQRTAADTDTLTCDHGVLGCRFGCRSVCRRCEFRCLTYCRNLSCRNFPAQPILKNQGWKTYFSTEALSQAIPEQSTSSSLRLIGHILHTVSGVPQQMLHQALRMLHFPCSVFRHDFDPGGNKAQSFRF